MVASRARREKGGSFFSAPEPLPPQALVRQAQPSPVDPARPATYKRAAMSSSGDSHGADGAEAEEDDRALLETVLRRVERSVRLAAETGASESDQEMVRSSVRDAACVRRMMRRMAARKKKKKRRIISPDDRNLARWY